MSFDERSNSDHDTLNGSIIVEAIIDEETPLLLPPSSYKYTYTPHDKDDFHAHNIKRTNSIDTLIDADGEDDSLLLKPLIAPQPTPLPWPQLLILLSLQLAEPLSSQIINPFVVEVQLFQALVDSV